MENNWIKDYLDENNEEYFTIYDYDLKTAKGYLFKFIYENNKISSLILENNVYKNTLNEKNHLQFVRELNLIKLHNIPFIYTERIRLYNNNHVGIYGYIEYKHCRLDTNSDYWESRGSIN